MKDAPNYLIQAEASIDADKQMRKGLPAPVLPDLYVVRVLEIEALIRGLQQSSAEQDKTADGGGESKSG